MAVLCVLCFGSVTAQQTGRGFDVKLWPQGPVVTNGRENLPEDGRKGIFTPEMRVFLPDSIDSYRACGAGMSRRRIHSSGDGA